MLSVMAVKHGLLLIYFGAEQDPISCTQPRAIYVAMVENRVVQLNRHDDLWMSVLMVENFDEFEQFNLGRDKDYTEHRLSR